MVVWKIDGGKGGGLSELPDGAGDMHRRAVEVAVNGCGEEGKADNN